MMDNNLNLSSDEMLLARQASKTGIAFGAMLLIFGMFAVMAPMFTGIATTVLIGFLLISAGVVKTVYAFKAESFGRGVFRFLFGGLTIVVGVVTLMTPRESLALLTIMLAGYFVASGVIEIVLAFKLRPEEGWGWGLFGGIVSILLGAFLFMQWPMSGLWAVGIYVGVRLFTHGWMLMALGKTGQQTLTQLQDARIEILEQQIRAGAKALHDTQAALVEQLALMTLLAAQLETRVAKADVDPSLRELNEGLVDARELGRLAEAATGEVWNAALLEANAGYEDLQQRASKLVGKLKEELGFEGA